MSDEIERLYDRLVMEEDLKSGTKYERLAAVVFRIFTEQTTVHDLRLVGSSQAPHQIDVVVGEADQRKRILIEAKDYNAKVGLGIVRDFFGVVYDLKPDDAFIVTTEGFTRYAVKFAAEHGITLALRRPPREEEGDWDNIIRKITTEISVTGQTGPPKVSWELHPDDHDQPTGDRGLGYVPEISIAGQNGALRPFQPLLLAEMDEHTVPLGGAGTVGSLVRFDEPTWLHLPGSRPLRVTGFKWEAESATADPIVVVSGHGIGGLMFELMLRSVDGGVHKMISNRDIAQWTLDDNGEIVDSHQIETSDSYLPRAPQASSDRCPPTNARRGCRCGR